MDLIDKIESLRYDIENGIETDVINISVRLIQIKDQALQQLLVSGSLPSEIYVTYDRSDGEIFCAFVDKEQCKREAEECGCGMQTIRLVGKQ